MAPGKRRKLKDGTIVYDVSYRDQSGRKKMKTCYSARQAREFHAEKVAERRRGGSPGDVRFGDFARKQHAFASISQRERTVLYHETILRNHLIPRFGNVWLTKLTREMVEEFLKDLRDCKDPKTGERKYSPRYLKGILKRLNVVLNAATDRRVIQANPASRLSKLFDPIDDEPELENSFREDQLLRVLHCSKQTHYHCYPLFLLLARAGLRSGEGIALDWGDVDMTKRVLHVRQSIGPRGDIQKTKSCEHRVVDMSEQLRETLLELRNTQVRKAVTAGASPPTRVFPDMTQVHASYQMKRILRRLGLPDHLRTYSLRHTFARLLLEKGIRVEDVQRRMGHKDVRITNSVYGKFADLSGQDAVNRLDHPALDEDNVVRLARR